VPVPSDDHTPQSSRKTLRAEALRLATLSALFSTKYTFSFRPSGIYLFIYYYARWQPYTYKTVIYTLHSYTKIKNIKTHRNNMTYITSRISAKPFRSKASKRRHSVLSRKDDDCSSPRNGVSMLPISNTSLGLDDARLTSDTDADSWCVWAVLSSVELRSSVALWCTRGTKWFGTHTPVSGCFVRDYIMRTGLTSTVAVHEVAADGVMVLFIIPHTLSLGPLTGKYTKSIGHCTTSTEATKALKLLQRPS